MLGHGPIAGQAIADISGGNRNSAHGHGESVAHAAGIIIAAAAFVGASIATASPKLIGRQANFHGESFATADRAEASVVGQSFVHAHGDVVGVAHATGVSLFHEISGDDIGIAHFKGESIGSAISIYPAYKKWEAPSAPGSLKKTEDLLFDYFGDPIDEIDVAFEQAGRAVVVAQRTTLGNQFIWIYWFDPFVNAFVFKNFGPGRNPRVILDDPFDTTNSDVLIFYVTLDEQRIVYRQQRDRYDIVYETPAVKVPHSYIDVYLQDVVKGRDGRLVVIYALHTINAGTWKYARLESSLYPYILDFNSWKPIPSVFLATSDLHSVVIERTIEIDAWQAIDPSFVSGTVTQPVIESGPPGTLNPIGNPVPFYDDVETWKAVDSNFISGTMPVVVIVSGLFDVDEWQAVDSNFQSGTLVLVVIVEVLFDIDSWQVSAAFQAAGSSLA